MTAVICAARKTSSNFVYTIISQNHPDGGLNTSYTTYVKSPCYHYVAKRLTSQIEVRHICKNSRILVTVHSSYVFRYRS